MIPTSKEILVKSKSKVERRLKMKYGPTWSEANNHRSNLKLGHINANSIGGFKFNEIKTWLQSGRLDVLKISETKVDATFPNSMFHVEGFRLCRCDRKETVEAVHAPT